jgi:hypothetical protein
MEFVLFLCAALSALTGAISGARMPGMEVQIERVAARAGAEATVAARSVAAIVRAQRLPGRLAVRHISQARAFVLHPAIPARGERRRE